MTRTELEKLMLSAYLRILNRDSVPTRAEAGLITALAEPAWQEIIRALRKSTPPASVTRHAHPDDPSLDKGLSDNRELYIQQSKDTRCGIVPEIGKPEDK
jgi:hypothetical protein